MTIYMSDYLEEEELDNEMIIVCSLRAVVFIVCGKTKRKERRIHSDKINQSNQYGKVMFITSHLDRELVVEETKQLHGKLFACEVKERDEIGIKLRMSITQENTT